MKPEIASRELLDLPPPTDVEAEKMVLGSILVSKIPNETFATISANLQSRDFHDDANRVVFENMIRLRRDGKPILMKLLRDSLTSGNAQDVSALDLVGGIAYLGSLAGSVASPFHGIYYASIVREKADKRRLLDLGLMTVQASHNGKPVADIVATLSETLDDLVRRNTAGNAPEIMSIGALVAANPTLHEPVIDGLLRRGETMNLIADTKRGKSWLAFGLALSVATGRDWLGRYRCEPGRCLLIDNELHAATLANRIPKVAKAMGIAESDYRTQLDVLPLRGRLLDLHGINRLLTKVERGDYSLIVLDAWYRAIPADVSENDNAPIAMLYNLIDQMTGGLDSGWANIHHASKGMQSGKAVTDVGAGAGSQSRAADTHIVLRPHQEDGIIVLDAVVRSFAPVQPFALRFEFPLWLPAMQYDPKKLAGLLTPGEKRLSDRDREGISQIEDALRQGDAVGSEITTRCGVSRDRLKRLLPMMVRDGLIREEPTEVKGNKCYRYHLIGDVAGF